jgi:hypothetical protein
MKRNSISFTKSKTQRQQVLDPVMSLNLIPASKAGKYLKKSGLRENINADLESDWINVKTDLENSFYSLTKS